MVLLRYFIPSCVDNGSCITCIMYADDLIIIDLSCPSVCGLQRLLDICASTVTCLQFNEFIDKKSQCIVLPKTPLSTCFNVIAW